MFFLLSILSFGQESVPINKLIRGFVFDNSYFTNIPIPVIEAIVQVKDTGRKTKTDKNGKFEIEAREGDELIVNVLFSKTKKIFIIDKNCYKINLGTVLLDYPIIMDRRSWGITKRQFRKIEREVKEKTENGFYDCLD